MDYKTGFRRTFKDMIELKVIETLTCLHNENSPNAHKHRLLDYWHFKGRKPLLGQLPAPSHFGPFAGMASPDERAL